MVKIQTTDLEGVLIVTPQRFSDSRGFFSETYNRKALASAGVTTEFVQDNHSLSVEARTVRGLHYQSPPHVQTKLVRVIHGAIFDVAVDARKDSPFFGRHIRVELSADNRAQLLIPAGFLHGFVTLEDNTEVVYKVDDFYSREHDGCVFWNDPALAIDWGVDPSAAKLSSKDAKAVSWADFESPFY